MASYASKVLEPSLENDINAWIAVMSQVTKSPEKLATLVEGLRYEMEGSTPAHGFRGGGTRQFSSTGGTQTNWRSSFASSNNRFGSSSNKYSFDSRAAPPPKLPAGRYQSRFKTSENLEHTILNTVIGNKLNAFTPLTYNDTRDFIYQIMDSGEIEFTRDFIEKVFAKATVEELYCALFAKLIAEIAHRYPVMYEEMNKYHKEFLKIFDTVQEDSEVDYAILVKQKQYRMGYGQFIAELAGLNALDKSNLFAMVTTILDKIVMLAESENKNKVVEEFIDCLIRLTKGLKDRSPKFYVSVKGELSYILTKSLEDLITRSDVLPSLTKKAKFGLMDLNELL